MHTEDLSTEKWHVLRTLMGGLGTSAYAHLHENLRARHHIGVVVAPVYSMPGRIAVI